MYLRQSVRHIIRTDALLDSNFPLMLYNPVVLLCFFVRIMTGVVHCQEKKTAIINDSLLTEGTYYKVSFIHGYFLCVLLYLTKSADAWVICMIKQLDLGSCHENLPP